MSFHPDPTYQRDIAQLGDPILRQKANAINKWHDPQLQRLVDDLLITVKQANGVGIAAPQVSQSLQLFIVASRPTLRYPYAPVMEPTPMLNPRILSSSQTTVKDWEGCLSVPDLRGLVPRHQTIQIEYCDRHGQLQTAELTDFVARIFQHEYDHLQGIVFVDQVEDPKDLISEAEYQKLVIPGNPIAAGHT
jgi:peptide deformylase